MIAGLLATSIGACGGGGGDDQFSNEPAGEYPVEIVAAKFPVRQRLDQNAYLKIGVRNEGRKRIPALAVTITLEGAEGVESAQPFSIRDPEPGLSIPDRPVWILDEGYPKIAGVAGPGGAQTSNQKTFDFGPLPPGDARVAIWKLAAVRAGAYKLRYRVNAGLSGSASAVRADGGGPPVGTFAARITAVPERTRINAQGQIVPLKPAAQTQSGGSGSSGGTSAGSGSSGGGYEASGPGSNPASGSLPPSGSGN